MNSALFPDVDVVNQVKRTDFTPEAQATPRLRQPQRLEQALALLPELEAARSNPKTSKEDHVKPVRVSRSDPEARKMKMAEGGRHHVLRLQ
ncbi:MAG: hypothetical protein KKI02_06980 [Planctomycetes bacterium]|nr:hypothetical protein [Planctomycetota bacterium]